MWLPTRYPVPLNGPPGGGLIPRGTRVEVFREIYWVFLVLGTAVGVVVISYMVYNAYTYRAGREPEDEGFEGPTLGELPAGSGGGKKLFLSFGISAVIVVSLIGWTYGTLLYVEQDSPVATGDHIEIDVVGYQFGWRFVYPNGHETDGTMRVPAGTPVQLNVTSRDVFHTFGAPGLRVKTDAIPGQRTTTWFIANETANYTAQCFELCGAGHSLMEAKIVAMEPGAYEEWYADTNASAEGNATAAATNETAGEAALAGAVA